MDIIIALLSGTLALAGPAADGPAPERSACASMIDPNRPPAPVTAANASPAPAASAPASPSPSPAGDETRVQAPRKGIPGNSMRDDSPQKRLEKLLSETSDALDRAKGDPEFKALLAKLRQSLARDASLADADLRHEQQQLEDQLAGLHAGEERVYPDKRTMDTWRGLIDALDGALQDRRKRQP